MRINAKAGGRACCHGRRGRLLECRALGNGQELTDLSPNSGFCLLTNRPSGTVVRLSRACGAHAGLAGEHTASLVATVTTVLTAHAHARAHAHAPAHTRPHIRSHARAHARLRLGRDLNGDLRLFSNKERYVLYILVQYHREFQPFRSNGLGAVVQSRPETDGDSSAGGGR